MCLRGPISDNRLLFDSARGPPPLDPVVAAFEVSSLPVRKLLCDKRARAESGGAGSRSDEPAAASLSSSWMGTKMCTGLDDGGSEEPALSPVSGGGERMGLCS